MEITTRVCDICYYEGSFSEQEKLYDCGELGDLCEKHFKKAYNFITQEKEKKVFIAKGTDVSTGEEVAVTFDTEDKTEVQATPRKRLPWL